MWLERTELVLGKERLERLKNARVAVMGLGGVGGAAAEALVLVLAPYAPHIAEELWSILGHSDCIANAQWPEFDAQKCEVARIKMAVQVVGKTRGTIEIDRNASDDDIVKAAQAIPAVAKQLDGKTIVKTIIVPGRILNFIAK